MGDDGVVRSTFAGEVSVGGDTAPFDEERPRDDAPPCPRYVVGGELGRGGMGRVVAAFDPLLARAIAVKVARADDPGAERRLLAEARIAAGLDHPGIVTVLDAGEDAEGRTFYAMRVVEGRSLAEEVASAPRGRVDPRLVRTLLAAAQAVAYAHEHGVVHRDLSASNVRVGARGEVVVMDWGLAAPVATCARGGLRCGTPGFAAPELAAAGPAGPASDVWSLGALLHLVLTRRPPAEGAALPASPPRGCPPPLWSIARKALAPAPEARYPTAAGLAEDLAAWLDAAPVSAHRDAPWERITRFGRRNPLALALLAGGAAGVAVLGTALGLAAYAARQDALAASTTLLLEATREAVRDDDHGRAVGYARRALALEPGSPDARGVLAAMAARPEVTREPAGGGDGCVTLDRDGAGRRACRAGDGLALEDGGRRLDVPLPPGHRVLDARLLAGGRVLVVQRAPGLAHVASVLGPDGATVRRVVLEGDLRALEVAAGGRDAVVAAPDETLLLGDAGSGLQRARPCGSDGQAVVAAWLSAEPPLAAVLCQDYGLAHVGPEGTTTAPLPDTTFLLRGPIAGAGLGDGRLVVGTIHGRVGLVDGLGRRILVADASPVGPVRAVRALPEAHAAAVLGEGGVAIWRYEIGAWMRVDPRPVLGAAATGGALVTFEAGGDALWRVPAHAPWHRSAWGESRTATAFSPDGTRVALGDGGGGVDVFGVGTGDAARAAGGVGVVKAVAWSPDGRWLAVATARESGVQVYDAATLAPVPGPWGRPALIGRHVAFLGPSLLVAWSWGRGRYAFDVVRASEVALPDLPAEDVVALAAAPEAGRLWALADDGRVFTVAREEARELRPAPEAVALGASRDGRLVALAGRGAVEVRDGATDETRGRIPAPGAPIEHVAVAADGRLALGRRDGTVEVRAADGTLALRLEAHQGRTGGLAFSPDGTRVATTGWDGVARVLVAGE